MSETAPPADLTLRPMAPADVGDVHRIEVAAAPDPWSRSLFEDELSSDGPDRQWLIAVTSGGPGDASDARTVVGFGGLLFLADEAHVMNLAVAPDRRRQGIAARLLATLLLNAGDRGALAATLEVRASNAAAIGLYSRFGFDQAGRRPRYYADGEDAVIMWAHKIYQSHYRDRLLHLGGAHDRQR